MLGNENRVVVNLVERVDEIDHEIINLDKQMDNIRQQKNELMSEQNEIMKAVEILKERLK